MKISRTDRGQKALQSLERRHVLKQRERAIVVHVHENTAMMEYLKTVINL